MKKTVFSIVVASALLFNQTASAASSTVPVSDTGTKTFNINVNSSLFSAYFDGAGIASVTLSGPRNYTFKQDMISELWELNLTNFVSGNYHLTINATGAWTGSYTTTLGTFTPAVPEPATNMMMMFGLLAMGATLRKSKSV